MSSTALSIGKTIILDDVVNTERVGTHSHITGLGLDKNLALVKSAEGLIGQHKARQAAGIIVKMIEERRLAGRCVLIVGPPSTGKTALATAMAHSLGPLTPFNMIAASEVFSLEMSKTEALTQAFRRSIAVEISEETDVLEGEVVEMDFERPSSDPTVSSKKHGSIILKTADMESSYDLGGKLIEALEKQGVHPGDVVLIHRENGKVSRLGRSYSHAKDFDVQSQITRFVPCPKGELAHKKRMTHMVSLHDVDVINSRPQGYATLFAGDTGEIAAEMRDQIDEKIDEWAQEGRASVYPGVLFIDEVHMLDIECFSWLNRALESPRAPLLILATNRDVSTIRGSDMIGPYGIPADMLDRSLIITTEKYSIDEVQQIIKLRANEECVDLEIEALDELGKIAQETSLRYALQLMTTGSISMDNHNRKRIALEDICEVRKLFLDVSQSAKYLKEPPNMSKSLE